MIEASREKLPASEKMRHSRKYTITAKDPHKTESHQLVQELTDKAGSVSTACPYGYQFFGQLGWV